MKFLLALGILLFVVPTQGACPLIGDMGVSIEDMRGSLEKDQELLVRKLCAEMYNDDASQAKLAEVYDKGTDGEEKNVKKALYYYQLSAENGNAASQGRLAELYMKLDEDRNGRAILYNYRNSIFPSSKMEFNPSQDKDRFNGEFLHPYVLLTLANEKAQNKWYYPTEVRDAPAFAKTLYKKFKIDEAKKKQLIQQATAWKKRKLLEVANEILSQEEYDRMVNTLYPKTGAADAFKRNQALKKFEEKVKAKKKKDK